MTIFRFRAAEPADADGDGVFNNCDACPGTIAGTVVDEAGCPPLVSGDFDRDAGVDTSDFNTFQACRSGPMVPHSGSAVCRSADLNGDQDVDLSDFGLFQVCLSGPGNPNCAPGTGPSLHTMLQAGGAQRAPRNPAAAAPATAGQPV